MKVCRTVLEGLGEYGEQPSYELELVLEEFLSFRSVEDCHVLVTGGSVKELEVVL